MQIIYTKLFSSWPCRDVIIGHNTGISLTLIDECDQTNGCGPCPQMDSAAKEGRQKFNPRPGWGLNTVGPHSWQSTRDVINCANLTNKSKI